jgi:hypothetical protein
VIQLVFFSTGKQYDDLKKKTMDKTLESTLKASINTKLSTRDDKGRRKGVEEVVVRWPYSVALVCLVLFVSKSFVNEIMKRLYIT